jgi:hypothetical protein
MKATLRTIPMDPNNAARDYSEVYISLLPETMEEVATIRWIQIIGIEFAEFNEVPSRTMEYNVRLIGKR